MNRFSRFTNRELVFLYNTFLMRKDFNGESTFCIKENIDICDRMMSELQELTFMRNISDEYGRANPYYEANSKKIINSGKRKEKICHTLNKNSDRN